MRVEYICAGLVRFPAGKELVHVAALGWSRWKPIPWADTDKFYRYGHCCDSLHKVYPNRWGSKSLTATKQSQTNPQDHVGPQGLFTGLTCWGVQYCPVGSGTGNLLDGHIKHSVLHGSKILQNDRPKEEAFLVGTCFRRDYKGSSIKNKECSILIFFLPRSSIR